MSDLQTNFQMGLSPQDVDDKREGALSILAP